jgi:hypothetical protein
MRLMRLIGAISLMICLAACTVTKYYNLTNAKYHVVSRHRNAMTYEKMMDGIQIEIRAYNKEGGNFYVSLILLNGRSDTAFVDFKESRSWYKSNSYSMNIMQEWGKVWVHDQIGTIAPGKKELVTLYQRMSGFSEFLWQDTVYSYIGAIHTSSGYNVALDTFEFVLQQAK